MPPKKTQRILPERKHGCKFCNKKFSSEKTLISHMCAKKQRYNDRNTIGSRMGLVVFQRFYALTTNAKKPKTVEDFIKSQYYNDFVKFGRHLVDLNPINAEKFIDYVIMNSVKLRDWNKDRTYNAFLKEFTQRELVQAALERTIKEMCKWAEANDSDYTRFFSEVNVNEATHMIRSGRISPWVFYLGNTPVHLMERMNAEHEKIIDAVVDEKFWKKKLLADKEDTKFAIEVLTQAGI